MALIFGHMKGLERAKLASHALLAVTTIIVNNYYFQLGVQYHQQNDEN